MKKFLILIFISTSLLHGMEQEQSIAEKNQATKLWEVLGNSDEPDLKFLIALQIIKPSANNVKWVKLPMELKYYLMSLQEKLGKKLLDLLDQEIRRLSCEDIQEAKLLVDAGADLDMSNNKGNNALILAILHENKELAHFLILAGSNVNMQNQVGQTALIKAVGTCNKAIVALFTEQKTLLDMQDEDGNTALIYAAMYGLEKIVEMLIEAGVDLTIKNKENKTAMDKAQQGSREIIIKSLKRSTQN